MLSFTTDSIHSATCYILSPQAELNTLTESRRHSPFNTVNVNDDDGEVFVNALTGMELEMNNIEHMKMEVGSPPNLSRRLDITLLVVVAWISFMIGFCFDDIQTDIVL